MCKIIEIFSRHCILTDPANDNKRSKKPPTKEEAARQKKNEEIIVKEKLRKGTGLNNSLKPNAGTKDPVIQGK
jgi:hypothetical protein